MCGLRVFSTGKQAPPEEASQEDYNLDEVSPAALSPEEEEVVASAAKTRNDRQQRRKDMTPAERQAMQLKRNERNAAIQKQQDEIDALDNPPSFEEYSKSREFQL